MSIAKHEWAWECDRELCTVCGEERPSEDTIRDLTDKVAALQKALEEAREMETTCATTVNVPERADERVRHVQELLQLMKDAIPVCTLDEYGKLIDRAELAEKKLTTTYNVATDISAGNAALRADVERLKWMLNQSVADRCVHGGPKSGSGVSTCKSCSSALADLAARYAESRG
jgi:hypothetical protein